MNRTREPDSAKNGKYVLACVQTYWNAQHFSEAEEMMLNNWFSKTGFLVSTYPKT
jgi:hypothetical protein